MNSGVRDYWTLGEGKKYIAHVHTARKCWSEDFGFYPFSFQAHTVSSSPQGAGGEGGLAEALGLPSLGSLCSWGLWKCVCCTEGLAVIRHEGWVRRQKKGGNRWGNRKSMRQGVEEWRLLACPERDWGGACWGLGGLRLQGPSFEEGPVWAMLETRGF